MAINTINATIQMRSGLEQDFDADQMTTGEWAVSKDKKYVRMCFSPGIVVRMATYEAFENDMLEIQTILATCQNIQISVDAMANLAKQHKDQAETFSNLSKSYAVGTDGEVREDDGIDNSKYYYELSKRLAQGFDGIIPMGTINFSDLEDPENQIPNYLFNISNSFTSDDRFKDGGGKYYGPGTNVIFTYDKMWDTLSTPTLILTNNLLATAPGTALDAVQGANLKTQLTAVTTMINCEEPETKADVLNLINDNIDLFKKTSVVPVRIYTTGKKLGEKVVDGNYLGFLEYFNGNITGFLTNHWNPANRLCITATLYLNTRKITIKFENFEYFYETINRLNSDLNNYFKSQDFSFEQTISAGTVGEFIHQHSKTLTIPNGYKVFGTEIVYAFNSKVSNVLHFVWGGTNLAVNIYRANSDGGIARFTIRVIYKK